MSIFGLSQEEMRRSLEELQQALSMHEQWTETMHRTLLCLEMPDERDLQIDSHKHCRFGQWLYNHGAARLGSHPAFSQIESSHEHLHDSARKMLIALQEQRPIPRDDYERFQASMKQMRLETLTTKHELEDALFNLDPLTGVASRIGMLTKLREQLALVQRKVHFTCIAIMDIDLFKNVNDTYGHLMGDEVLAKLAAHMTSRLRPYDTLFRYGGEEFLLCAPSTDLEEGKAMVERLREELAGIGFKGEGQPAFRVTVSFGLTLLDSDVTIEQSIDRADKALYAAKAAGRNQTKIWDASMI